MKQLLKKVLDGNTLTFEESLIAMDSTYAPLDELIRVAEIITLRNFRSELEVCAIHAAKVGKCSANCAFCAQSSYHKSNISVLNPKDIDSDTVVSYALSLQKNGVSRFSLVTSGEFLTEHEFEQVLCLYCKLRAETNLKMCASLGILNESRAKLLVENGITRYHHNLETSQSYFPNICSTHSYNDKLETIHIARKAGMEICSGGIISMGETAQQRVEMAYALRELDVDSIPINILNPIVGTRLENQVLLSVDEILRTIAVFRMILPNKTLRFAGGRQNAMGLMEYWGYKSGINALMTGNFLTTNGTTVEEEIENLKARNYFIK